MDTRYEIGYYTQVLTDISIVPDPRPEVAEGPGATDCPLATNWVVPAG